MSKYYLSKYHLSKTGCNNFGQLGQGNYGQKTAIYQPKIIKYFKKKHIGINEIGCGGNHSVVLDQNGRVYCFGRNYSFECGNGDNKNNVIQPLLNKELSSFKVINIKCGLQHNVAKTVDYDFYLWGANDFNQCLVCDINENFVKIPSKYNGIDGISNWLDYKIIDIYPGWKETRIVTAKLLRTSYL